MAQADKNVAELPDRWQRFLFCPVLHEFNSHAGRRLPSEGSAQLPEHTNQRVEKSSTAFSNERRNYITARTCRCGFHHPDSQ